jgi:hypothetical protein
MYHRAAREANRMIVRALDRFARKPRASLRDRPESNRFQVGARRTPKSRIRHSHRRWEFSSR